MKANLFIAAALLALSACSDSATGSSKLVWTVDAASGAVTNDEMWGRSTECLGA